MHNALVISNARSGSGKAAQHAPAIISALQGTGAKVTHLPVGPGLPRVDVAQAVRGADVLIVLGGDGTVRSCAPGAIATGTPIYHIPCGNENLFAREFNMDTNPATLLRAWEQKKIVMMDIGEATWGGTPVPFLLMASTGPDASVIHRLHNTRSKASGHLAYLRPILDELRNPALPRVTVTVDGQPVVTDRRGVLVIANCGQYAMRIDPCAGARVDDGLLDVCFMPAESAMDVLAWFIKARLRRHGSAVRASGRVIEVAFPGGPAPLQIDGEAIPAGPAGGTLELTVATGVLPVLDAR